MDLLEDEREDHSEGLEPADQREPGPEVPEDHYPAPATVRWAIHARDRRLLEPVIWFLACHLVFSLSSVF